MLYIEIKFFVRIGKERKGNQGERIIVGRRRRRRRRRRRENRNNDKWPKTMRYKVRKK